MAAFSALLNGKIITVNNRNEIAEAMLLADDTIVAVGSTAEIRKRLPKGGSEIDLAGRAVIPGIVDSHVHLELTANQMAHNVNVQQPGCGSLEEIFNKIRDAASKKPKGEWLVAVASNMFTARIAERRLPTRKELDAVCPDHPLLFTTEVHVIVMNSPAVAKLGWTHESLLPRGGTMGRDPVTGEPTGVYCEVWNALSLTPWGYDALLAALRVEVAKNFVSKGVTSVHELPYSFDGVRAWQRLRAENALPLRLRLFFTDHELIDIRKLFGLGLEKGFGDAWLCLGGMKLFADGVSQHANLYRAVDLKYTQEELDNLICEAHAANFQVWVHAIAEEAFTRTVRACRKALKHRPDPDARMRVEHSGDLMPLYANRKEKLALMKELGLVLICTPQFSYAFDNYRTPYKSYVRDGFILPYNSDATGSQPEACNPWHGIWNLVTGKNFRGGTNLPDECLTPMEAIRMATLWGAWGGFEERIKGSLEPGKLADFAVLGQNPLTCERDALREMPVELVAVGGRAKSASPAFRNVLDG